MYPSINQANMSLDGKVAIVTGGARGIGAGIVRSLSQRGAKVAFNYVSPSSKSAADTLVDEIRRNNKEAIAIQADITDMTAPNTIIQTTLAAFKTDHVDILVNNAGLGVHTPLEEVTLEEYTKIMDVNVCAVIFMTQAVLPVIPRGGRIVNVSSIAARGGYPTQSVYAASKAALECLTWIWKSELGHKYGVTVNAVSPGPVDTDLYQSAGLVHLARM